MWVQVGQLWASEPCQSFPDFTTQGKAAGLLLARPSKDTGLSRPC